MESTTKKILAVVGTRPEAIKMAPLVEALRSRPEELDVRVALTGQHTTLVDQVLDIFDMEPAYDLAIMKDGQTLYEVAHGCLDGLRGVVQEFRPDLVLAQGDTATVFLASLVAFFERIRVGHVEAGLRSGNKWAPYPEEMFRRLTDVLTDFYFAPTDGARDHLLGEGVPPDRVFVTGNTVVDALRSIVAKGGALEHSVIRDVAARGNRLVLMTAHRRESFGDPLRELFGAVVSLVDEFGDIEVVYPVHPNPNVRGPAEELLGGHARIHLTEPLGYLDLVHGLQAAKLVLTDSGGIQEEAPTFGTPVLVLREVTERPEAVDAGAAWLVGTDRERILSRARSILRGAEDGRSPGINPYGDGRAGERIADILVADLLGIPRRTEDWVAGTP